MSVAVTSNAAPSAASETWLRYRRYLPPLVIVLLWQAGASTGLLPTRTLASPAMIARTSAELIASGELPRHLLVSLGRVATGLAIGVAAGTTLALIAGLSRRGEDLLDATLQMLRTLPFLALVPLFILWFGIGETPKIALVALGTTFPIYLTLFAGIRGVDAKLMEAGSTLGLNRREQVFHIVLPGALPSALVGLRYALGVAWLSLVVAEQINAESGRIFRATRHARLPLHATVMNGLVDNAVQRNAVQQKQDTNVGGTPVRRRVHPYFVALRLHPPHERRGTGTQRFHAAPRRKGFRQPAYGSKSKAAGNQRAIQVKSDAHLEWGSYVLSLRLKSSSRHRLQSAFKKIPCRSEAMLPPPEKGRVLWNSPPGCIQ